MLLTYVFLIVRLLIDDEITTVITIIRTTYLILVWGEGKEEKGDGGALAHFLTMPTSLLRSL